MPRLELDPISTKLSNFPFGGGVFISPFESFAVFSKISSGCTCRITKLYHMLQASKAKPGSKLQT